MPHQTIIEFDIVFALHTGVTIMMPKQSAFDKNDEAELLFRLSEPADGTITLRTVEGSAVEIKGVRDEMMREIKARGFFMIYEMDDDDIVRCAPCQIEI
tara:strand:+ start:2461 stop:2757 length:297 start_codon:yes stop_codon:yes gene_type:complete